MHKIIQNGNGTSKVIQSGGITVSLLQKPNENYLSKTVTRSNIVRSDDKIINSYVNAKIKDMAIKELIKDGVLDTDGKLKK
jgi:hypothetical protein